MEKQKIALNFTYLQNEMQEIKKHVRSATDRIPEIRFKQANLFKLASHWYHGISSLFCPFSFQSYSRRF